MKKEQTIEEVNKLKERCEELIIKLKLPDFRLEYLNKLTSITFLSFDGKNFAETVRSLWELLKELKRCFPRPSRRVRGLVR